MRSAILVLVTAAIVGCDGRDGEMVLPDGLAALELQAAETDAQRYLGVGAKILAVCGSSKGVSLYSDELAKGFEDDGITGGVIVFASRQDGRPEVLSRDITKQMIVASEDTAEISRIGEKSTDATGVWVLQYPSTGVVISYNLSPSADGKLLNIWTQNKPAVGPLPPRTSTFLSRCETRL